VTKNLVLKSQKNTILEIIQSYDISPEQFVWDEIQSVIRNDVYVSRLVHKSSGYYFQFDFYDGRHYCTFSPGENKDIESVYPEVWDQQLLRFEMWLNYLLREVQAPDLWGAIANEKALSEVSYEHNENTSFTEEEILKIQKNLEEIKKYLISAQSFSPEQLHYLDVRFNYLQDAASRIGRKDWIILVVGTITNIIITYALSSAVARELFHIAGLLLKWVIGIPLLG
jgi:hypothetical protein